MLSNNLQTAAPTLLDASREDGQRRKDHQPAALLTLNFQPVTVAVEVIYGTRRLLPMNQRCRRMAPTRDARALMLAAMLISS